MQELNEQIARKVLTTVDAGLVSGLGSPKPGLMCVEAAVCFAYGLLHSDSPPCVGSAVRAYKIGLNDSRWSTSQARTEGMRALAIAQLGSDAIDQKQFARLVVEGTICRVLPIALRAAATVLMGAHKDKLEAAALRCEREGNREAALHACTIAADAADAAAAADADAADAADAAAADAADAADAAAADAADAAARAARDSTLRVAADVCLQALVTCKSPGVQYLYLLDAPTTA